jgi:Protein of unknown function (DUF1552)
MKRLYQLQRREFLKSLGVGAALGNLLPPLSAFAQQAAPKRFIYMCSNNGTVHEKWVPSYANSTLTLSTILAPLEALKAKINVIDGLGYNASRLSGHEGGMACGLTGRPVAGNYGNSNGTGISVDQYLAPVLSKGLARESLILGIGVETIGGIKSMSYKGDNQELTTMDDPRVVWERVFKDAVLQGGGGMPDPKAEEKRLNRRSMLDAVRKDLKRLNGVVGTDDKRRIEAHLGSVEELDKSLSMTTPAIPTSQAACMKPTQPVQMPAGPYDGNNNFPKISTAQIDLLVTAMACDLTRVGGLQFGRGGAQHIFSWLGNEFQADDPNGKGDGTKGIHSLAHNEDDPSARAKLVRCHTWYAQQFAYLVKRLNDIPEGSGTMLDNTVVVWLNETGNGNHSMEKIPLVMAGNVGGFFKTGRLITAQGQPHNRLLLSILRAFGNADKTFGDANYCGAGPLDSLT